MLINVGVDVDARFEDGTTVLKLAMENGYTEVVEILKAAGATE